MDRNYWEKIAPQYNEEIFDVLQNDNKGIIAEAIIESGAPHKTVMDAGCAVGKWIPLLANHYQRVIAADISEKNLELAASINKEFNNIEYLRIDLSAGNITISPCDVVICINAILTDSLSKRTNFYNALSLCVKPGGTLILVVPSIESALLSAFMYDQIMLDMNKKPKKETKGNPVAKYNNLKRGIVELDEVPTKHHLKEELVVLLQKEGFKVTRTEKIEYKWETEFDNPPEWMGAPYPWDWMVIAQKKQA